MDTMFGWRAKPRVLIKPAPAPRHWQCQTSLQTGMVLLRSQVVKLSCVQPSLCWSWWWTNCFTKKILAFVKKVDLVFSVYWARNIDLSCVTVVLMVCLTLNFVPNAFELKLFESQPTAKSFTKTYTSVVLLLQCLRQSWRFLALAC